MGGAQRRRDVWGLGWNARRPIGQFARDPIAHLFFRSIVNSIKAGIGDLLFRPLGVESRSGHRSIRFHALFVSEKAHFRTPPKYRKMRRRRLRNTPPRHFSMRFIFTVTMRFKSDRFTFQPFVLGCISFCFWPIRKKTGRTRARACPFAVESNRSAGPSGKLKLNGQEI